MHPSCPAVLAAVLRPWAMLVADIPTVQAWLYMDDRSIGTRGGGQAAVQAALAATAQFGEAVGLVLNDDKTQRWEGTERPEHLGLKCSPASVCPAECRVGTAAMLEDIAALRRCPCSNEVRISIAVAFVCSRWTWAAPLVALPADTVVVAMRKALWGLNRWYCRDRCWVEAVAAHPRWGTAIAGLSRLQAVWRQFPSEALAQAAREYAGCLGAWLGLSEAEAVLRPAVEWPRQLERCMRQMHGLGDGSDGDDGGWRARPLLLGHAAAPHALRTVVRYRCLAAAGRNSRRNDTEAVEEVDLEAARAAPVKRWLRQQTPRDRGGILAIRRGGMTSATRRRGMVGNTTSCRCGAEWGSLRHVWQDCPC